MDNLTLRIKTSEIRLYILSMVKIKKLYFIGLTFLLLLKSNPSFSNQTNINELNLSDAIKIALKNNNQLKIAGVITKSTESAIELKEGDFDTNLSASVLYQRGKNPTFNPNADDILKIRNESSAVSLGATKKLKTGQIISLTVSSESNGDSYSGTEFNEASNSNFGISIIFPLWQGRGSYITNTPLNIAKKEFLASNYDLKFQVERLIYETASSYWAYKGAVTRLELLRNTEKRTEKLLKDIQALITADELPRAESNVVKAQLSQRIDSRLQAEQAVIESRFTLSNRLGLALSSGLQEVQPTTSLLVPHLGLDILNRLSLSKLLQRVQKNRNDFLAIKTRFDIAESQVELANELTKPSLNFQIGHNSKSLKADDRFMSSIDASYNSGLNFQLNFNWIPSQNASEANKRIAVNNVSQLRINELELQRKTMLDLNAAIFSYKQSVNRYVESNKRLDFSKKNLINERKKLKLSSSTLLDVISFEDKLLSAELDLIQEKVNYGSSLARLIYLTGYLEGKVSSKNEFILKKLENGKQFMNLLFKQSTDM